MYLTDDAVLSTPYKFHSKCTKKRNILFFPIGYAADSQDETETNYLPPNAVRGSKALRTSTQVSTSEATYQPLGNSIVQAILYCLKA